MTPPPKTPAQGGETDLRLYYCPRIGDVTGADSCDYDKHDLIVAGVENLRKNAPTPHQEPDTREQCPECGGTGRVKFPLEGGRRYTESICGTCNGCGHNHKPRATTPPPTPEHSEQRRIDFMASMPVDEAIDYIVDKSHAAKADIAALIATATAQARREVLEHAIADIQYIATPKKQSWGGEKVGTVVDRAADRIKWYSDRLREVDGDGEVTG